MKKIFSNIIKIFSNIIEKSKNFVTNLTPTAKLRYIVISVVTVAVAASLLVVVSLNTSKPEVPTNPEDFGSGEAASIDFDNEITFEVDGESSNVDTADNTAGITTKEPSVTTDGVSETVESATAEESTNAGIIIDTEPIDDPEPQPTDPSEEYNPDPQPEDTTNTPVVNLEPTETTTQTQTTPKPTETTTKAPQTEPKPTETTTKAHQTEPKPTETTNTPQIQPKPTETTTTVPQTTAKPVETTKPHESDPQETGVFSLREKKYDYKGANVSIVQVENKADKAYTITITGKFKDANGNTVKTESKTFEGFPAGWKNHFVFQPGIKYNSVSWDMQTDEFSGDTVAQRLFHGDKVSVGTSMGLSDGSGEFIYPSAERPIDTLKQYVTVFAYFHPIYCENISRLTYSAEYVVFDANGEICLIDRPGKKIDFYPTKDNPYTQSVIMFVTDVLWENKESYTLPNNLKNISGIMSITSISE